jgi:TB2/DP1, HVA22 family
LFVQADFIAHVLAPADTARLRVAYARTKCRIPLYWELKLCLIFWMILPGTRGAEQLYTDVVYPFLHQYASKFDPNFATKQVRPMQLSQAAFVACLSNGAGSTLVVVVINARPGIAC